jgi:hypothetical protein
VWLITGDDNRAEDGVELREEYLSTTDAPYDQDWLELPCSLLEMLIAFSRRAEFNTDISAKDWFWEFVHNLGLMQFNDAYGASEDEIGQALYAFIWRQYDYRGHGGMFPLHHATHDQAEVEIWYQFCDYLVDQDRMP